MGSDRALWAQLDKAWPQEKREAWHAAKRVEEARRAGVVKVDAFDLWRDRITGIVYLTREEAMDRAISRLLDHPMTE